LLLIRPAGHLLSASGEKETRGTPTGKTSSFDVNIVAHAAWSPLPACGERVSPRVKPEERGKLIDTML
jgi:hypothetical protein